VLSYNPLRLFLPTGFALLALGTGKLIYDLNTYDFRVTTNTLLILFAAFQVFAIGLLADLVVRVSRDRDEVPVAVETQSTTGSQVTAGQTATGL
jgi:hypothetical protein